MLQLPPYDTFPTLHSEGIILRPVRPSDREQLLPISFYEGQQARTAGEAAAMHEKISLDYANGNSIHWAIEDEAAGQLVGTCGYYRGFPGGTGEPGCILLPSFYGRGYMTRAMKAAIGFGRHRIGLQRITAITTRQNSKAIQLLERLGFTRVTGLNDHDVEYQLPPFPPGN